MLKTTKWDMADDIKTKEDVLGVLSVALEENDAEFLLKVIGDVARSEGMARLAGETGVSREGLYTSLSAGGNPSFVTVMKVLNQLGFEFQIVSKKSA
jgi:probable addiction module antidote protein